MGYHTPVLLKEAIEHLQINIGKKYIDATLGDGGHTIEILKLGGKVLGIDVNATSLARATSRIKELGLSENFVGLQGNFTNIDDLAIQSGFDNAHGVLFDLGYSSTQLENDDLGLTFSNDELLDMRLDPSLGVTAADLVNALPEKALENLIRDYSDEMYASRISKAIVVSRESKKIQTTNDLVEIIKSVTPLGYENGRINPATRTFQALRIAVNDELNNLEFALPRAAQVLLPGGRLVVISFHSLEDRLVKQFGQLAQPYIKQVYKKPLVPTNDEVRANIRSRSAKIRVYEKTN